MTRRTWIKSAIATVAGLAGLVGLHRTFRPPDLWVRRFRTETFDYNAFFAIMGTRHPVYTDMVCRNPRADLAFDGDRRFWNIEVEYYREPRTIQDAAGRTLARLVDFYKIGPDVPAAWVPVA